MDVDNLPAEAGRKPMCDRGPGRCAAEGGASLLWTSFLVCKMKEVNLMVWKVPPGFCNSRMSYRGGKIM